MDGKVMMDTLVKYIYQDLLRADSTVREINFCMLWFYLQYGFKREWMVKCLVQ